MGGLREIEWGAFAGADHEDAAADLRNTEVSGI